MVRAAYEPSADDSIFHSAGLLAEAFRNKTYMSRAAWECPAPLCAYYNSIDGAECEGGRDYSQDKREKTAKSVTNGQKYHKFDCIFDSFAIKTVQITRKRWTNQYFQQSK